MLKNIIKILMYYALTDAAFVTVPLNAVSGNLYAPFIQRQWHHNIPVLITI